MSIIAPRQRELNVMLIDLGQDIILREITRTVDNDGLVTSETTLDNTISAIVEEIGEKHFDLLESGYYDVGDVDFYIDPNETISIFDKIIWNNEIYGVRKIFYPQKISGYYIYKKIHGVRDTVE